MKPHPRPAGSDATGYPPPESPDEVDRGAPLYHLALAEDWAQVVAEGRDYDRSTLGRSLQEEGFVHASFASQVAATADAFYRDREVVLLRIDQARLRCEVRLEQIPDGGVFPHIYGPVPIAAVTSVDPLPMLPDGGHDLTGLLGP